MVIFKESKELKEYIAIAIDGPSGAGKSTLAKNLAQKLGFIYLDTGALYRTVGLHIAENTGDCGDCNKITYNTDKLENFIIDVVYEDGVQKIYADGDDVSEKIRENHVSKYASDVSKINKVREFLLRLQRDTAEKNNVVMDGRDIGTVILPNADVKIFLTASPEKRAERRYAELMQKSQNNNNNNIDYDKILKEITERDKQDSTRDIAPLRPAEDAVFLDSTDCSSPGVTLEKALKIIKEALPYVSIR